MKKIFFENIQLDQDGNAIVNGKILKAIEKHKRIYKDE